MPGVHGGEDERPAHPPAAAVEVEDKPHPPEVHLQFRPRLAVGHPHGGAVLPVAEALGGEAAGGGVGDDLAGVAGEQAVDLDEGESLLETGGDEVGVLLEQRPALPVGTRAPARPHRLDDRSDELISEPLGAVGSREADGDRGVDVAPHSLRSAWA